MFSGKRITLEGMIKANNPKRRGGSKDEGLETIFENSQKETRNKRSNDETKFGILTLLEDKEFNNHRNKDLGEPTGRREVELLNQWLDQMLKAYVFSKTGIKKDPEKRKEALYHAKLILSICLRDLIRQVSVQ